MEAEDCLVYTAAMLYDAEYFGANEDFCDEGVNRVLEMCGDLTVWTGMRAEDDALFACEMGVFPYGRDVEGFDDPDMCGRAWTPLTQSADQTCACRL